jgi:hypothetical protein
MLQMARRVALPFVYEKHSFWSALPCRVSDKCFLKFDIDM